MSTIAVQEFITLDCAVQTPGVPDEDREGGAKDFEPTDQAIRGWVKQADLGGRLVC